MFFPNSVGADDCFKSEVDELLNDARSNGDNALSSPIDIAMIQQCVNILKPHKLLDLTNYVTSILCFEGSSSLSLCSPVLVI